MLGSFCLHEFDLRIGVPQFRKLRLQQSVITRVVYEPNVIRHLGVEANDQKILYERNRVCFQQVRPGKRARAANGFDEGGPQAVQLRGWRRSGGGRLFVKLARSFRRHRTRRPLSCFNAGSAEWLWSWTW